MRLPQRGEVWLVDLGLAAKVRPALVLSIPPGDLERVIVTLVPHTTALRGSEFEVGVSAPFLHAGAFNVQGLVTVPAAHLVRVLGRLTASQLIPIERAVMRWLGLPSGAA